MGKQYNMAVERYEWNKLQCHKSEVPMIYLSWNIAKNVRVSETKLFEAVKNTLLRSMRQVMITLEYVRSKGCELKFHGRSRSEPAHFCGQCETEVFGVLFIREQARRHSKELKGFVCLEEYHLKELREVYNLFKLTSQNPVPQYPRPQPAQQESTSKHSVSSKSPSSSSPLAPHSLMGPGLSVSNMMSSMASMTPQQQLALQQAIA